MVKKNLKFGKPKLPFTPENCRRIRNGTKWKTYRLGEKYSHFEPGDKCEIVRYDTEETVAWAIVTKMDKVQFADLPIDVDGHETYRSKEHQRNIFNGYYEYIGREINDDDSFLMIELDAISKQPISR